jgi:hypothetical protein
MPKTRSGKIMRRVITSISNFTDVGDVTTLANPEIVDDIRHHAQSAKVRQGRRATAADRGRVRGDQEVRRRVAGSVTPTRPPRARAAVSDMPG